MEAAILNAVQKEIDQKRLSGAIIQVNYKAEPIVKKGFGTEAYRTKINAGNVVEVAAILPLMLKLVERRRSKLALNHKLAQYFPEFKAEGKEDLQIMNLLTHTSGLAPEDFTQALLFSPGSKVMYNEQNFKLLPAVFEMVSGYSFHQYYQELILDPMRMEQTELTEDYQLWTTVDDLGRYATMIEQDGTYDYLKIINKRAVQLSKQNFTSFLNENRGLGWVLQGASEEEAVYSEPSYGYLNDARTSLWFDPKVSLNIVLHLTPFSEGDRVYLKKIRRDIHRIIRKNL